MPTAALPPAAPTARPSSAAAAATALAPRLVLTVPGAPAAMLFPTAPAVTAEAYAALAPTGPAAA